MNSPTQRTLALLRKEGWDAQVVERWIPQTKRRLDLFGCIDIVACKPGVIMGVQATSASHHNHRVIKSLNEPRLKSWLYGGGRFEVWSWAKKGKKGQRKLWQVRRQRLTLREVEDAVREADRDGQLGE